MDMTETGRIGGVPLSAAAPLLCVGHCLATPVFVVAAPALAVNPVVEIGLMMVAAAVAFTVVALGVRRHGDGRVWLPIVLGLGLWGVGMLATLHLHERLLTVAGGLTLAAGLYWDARLRHRISCSSCQGSG
jgi:hypothetical protein